MNLINLRNQISFGSGVIISLMIILLKDFYIHHTNIISFHILESSFINKTSNQSVANISNSVIRTEYFKNLIQTPKILCYINTIPKTHQSKAIHVRNTWAKRCTKYLFMSSETYSQLPTVALNLSFPESRKHLWSKMRAILRYVYQFRNEYDYFLKADDDTFVVMENLRDVLRKENPEDPFMVGHKFQVYIKNGYFSGGAGYVLSRAALKAIVEKAIDKHPKCPKYDEDKEDVKMSLCGQAVGVKLYHLEDIENIIPFGWRTELNNHYLFQWRNFQQHFGELLNLKNIQKFNHYSYKEFRNVLDVLSNKLISLHYIQPFYMYTMEFLLYQHIVINEDNKVRNMKTNCDQS